MVWPPDRTQFHRFAAGWQETTGWVKMGAIRMNPDGRKRPDKSGWSITMAMVGLFCQSSLFH
jgi:hypothetical protein